MMKSESGFTAISVVVAAIIFALLLQVGIQTSYEAINKVKDDKLIGELGIVRQAITQQYSKAIAVNQINFDTSKSQVSFFVGERIDSSSKKIKLPPKARLSETTDAIDKFYSNAVVYNLSYQEDFYYRLSPENLKKIGIDSSDNTYIVNYKTGEVYNETVRMTGQRELLYLSSTLNN